MRIVPALRFAFGRMDVPGLRQRRSAAIVQGVASGLASRVVGVVVGLLSVPLTIGYLGAERYGAWTLIASLLAWLRLADIGIGNGLNNAIASALGAERPDLARSHISTALAVLGTIAVALGAIVVLAWPWVEWSRLFGLRTEIACAEIGPAMAAAVAIFLAGFPLSIVNRVYTASQEGKLANYWGAAANVASLAALLVVTRTQGGLPWLVIAVSGTALAVDAISGVWLFVAHRPAMAPKLRGIRRESAGALMQIGIQFFVIQIMALVVFETDTLVVAHFLGADQVPSYSLTYRLFGYTALVQSLLFNYLWVAYSEAIARRDIDWVARSFRNNLVFSMVSTLAMVVPLVFVAQAFIRLWAGEVAVPSTALVLWIAAWTLINAFCSPVACLLAAAGHLKAQLVYSGVSTIANLVLSIVLVQRWGSAGVIAATVIAYLLFICGPLAIDANGLLKKLRGALRQAGPEARA